MSKGSDEAQALTDFYSTLSTDDLLWLWDESSSLAEKVFVSAVLEERTGDRYNVQIRPIN